MHCWQDKACAEVCPLLLSARQLPGSERIKKTQAAAGSGGDAHYEQLRESSCINKSLSFLEQVVNALARGDAHVPFRWVSGLQRARAPVSTAGAVHAE